ncbi:response regulator [Duganella sp. FT92W]|uniref:Response regulator n=1 Tax=Pseudoduganella rivuli TaxID=2666085 RepID=A0A7X2IQH1_9BURK|nr:response regulator transcription factor [Pseudoduganella rivuli]MRV74098.1 response regulator [Pseudoduganella rivuli]
MADFRDNNKVLIVEDHPLVADATALLLSRMSPALQVTIRHCAVTALATFYSRADWFRVLLDLDVPGAEGLALARKFAQSCGAGKVAIITAHDLPAWRTQASELGILDYIVKASPMHEFTESLARVIGAQGTGNSTKSAATLPLTRRQQDMLCLLRRGYSSKDIANQLRISQGTVDNHISSVLRALRVTNRAHAVAKAIELGYS